MRRPYERWVPDRYYTYTNDGLRHAVIGIDGGFLMDDEDAQACTGVRRTGEKVSPGVPNCVQCWAVVCT